MYLDCIWIKKNWNVFVLEKSICIWIEIKKSNVFVFNLAELYLLAKCVFTLNAADNEMQAKGPSCVTAPLGSLVLFVPLVSL